MFLDLHGYLSQVAKEGPGIQARCMYFVEGYAHSTCCEQERFHRKKYQWCGPLDLVLVLVLV